MNCVIMHMLFLHPAHVKTFLGTFIWGLYSQAADWGGDSFFFFFFVFRVRTLKASSVFFHEIKRLEP